MKWILIVAWLVHGGTGSYTWGAVSMQEFNNVQACKFASIEVQKIAPDVHVVCVPNGEQHD